MTKSRYGNFWNHHKNHAMENHTMEIHVSKGISVYKNRKYNSQSDDREVLRNNTIISVNYHLVSSIARHRFETG